MQGLTWFPFSLGVSNPAVCRSLAISDAGLVGRPQGLVGSQDTEPVSCWMAQGLCLNSCKFDDCPYACPV